MRKLWLVPALLFFVLLTNAQKSKPAVDTRLTGLDAELEKILKDWKISGFAVAVVEKDKIVYSKGFGYRDYENKQACYSQHFIRHWFLLQGLYFFRFGIIGKRRKT